MSVSCSKNATLFVRNKQLATALNEDQIIGTATCCCGSVARQHFCILLPLTCKPLLVYYPIDNILFFLWQPEHLVIGPSKGLILNLEMLFLTIYKFLYACFTRLCCLIQEIFCRKMLDFDVLIVNVLQDCPDDSGDFRAAQCSEYDSTPLGGKLYYWFPYYEGYLKV